MGVIKKILFGKEDPELTRAELLVVRELGKMKKPITAFELSVKMNKSRRWAFQILQRLKEKEVIKKVGQGYVLNKVQASRTDVWFFIGLMEIVFSFGLQNVPLLVSGIGIMLLSRILSLFEI